MVFYGKTDVGAVRAVNQDNFTVRSYSSDVLVAVVCDGMGGANGGSVASAMASQTFLEVLDSYNEKMPLFADMTDEEKCNMLKEAAAEANRAVYQKGSSEEALSGMGTTLVACLVMPEMLYAVNVGDSRMYVTAGEVVTQVTHDHSYVQYLVDIGKLTAEEAKTSKNRNIITRAVGTERTVDADTFMLPPEEYRGEYIVLCTDGLTNYVDAKEIGELLRECSHEDEKSLCSACDLLIQKANERGGSDNITAVIASV